MQRQGVTSEESVVRVARQIEEDRECAEGAVVGAGGENGRMGGCAKDRFSRQNPAKDCRADRVFSSFVACGSVCLPGFVPGHGPTTLTRLQKCAQDIEQSPNFYSGLGISLSIMPKISIHESVEAVENFQERIPERMCEQVRMIDVPKVSSQEGVEAVKKLSFGSKFSERMCEQMEFVQVPRISSQEQILQRAVEQVLEEFGVPRGRGTAKSDDFIQELDAMFNQDAVFENVIDCRLREVKNDKEVAEKEWLDLTLFLGDRLRSRNCLFLF